MSRDLEVCQNLAISPLGKGISLLHVPPLPARQPSLFFDSALGGCLPGGGSTRGKEENTRRRKKRKKKKKMEMKKEILEGKRRTEGENENIEGMRRIGGRI